MTLTNHDKIVAIHLSYDTGLEVSIPIFLYKFVVLYTHHCLNINTNNLSITDLLI